MKIKTSLCAGAALGVFALAIAGGAAAQDTTTAWKGAPQWTNDDVQFKVRGRILLDYVYQDVDRAAPLARADHAAVAAVARRGPVGQQRRLDPAGAAGRHVHGRGRRRAVRLGRRGTRARARPRHGRLARADHPAQPVEEKVSRGNAA